MIAIGGCEEESVVDPLDGPDRQSPRYQSYYSEKVTLSGTSLDGKAVSFIPSLDEDKRIRWRCTSDEIQDKYLPMQCRQPR